MTQTLIITHAILSVLLIIFVLVQFGKGAQAGLFSQDTGGAFSASQSGNILAKITTALATVFLLLSVGLAVMLAKTGDTSIFADEAQESAIPLNSDQANESVPAEAAPAQSETEANESQE